MNWERLQQNPDFQALFGSDKVEAEIASRVEMLLEGTWEQVIEARAGLETIRFLQTIVALEAAHRQKGSSPAILAQLRPRLKEWLAGWVKKVLPHQKRSHRLV